MSGRNSLSNAAQSSSMSLHCMLCDRKFSDHSHLLTHLGSKGHLTKSHEVTIKANSDPTYARLLNDFNRWYARHGLGEHIKVRFDQKEKKKANAAKEKAIKKESFQMASMGGTPGPVSTGRNTPVPSYPLGPTNYRTQSLRENTLDPQLGPYIKTEPTSRSTTPNMPYHIPAAYAASSMARSYVPPMMDAPTTPYSMGSQRRIPSILDSVHTPTSSDEDYYEPTPRTSRRSNKRNLSVSTTTSNTAYPLSKNKNKKIAIDLPWEPIPATIKDPNSKVDHVMIFDIQNAEGRKNRNQKKSVEVISTLMHNSSVSLPDEVVFKEGIERTTRLITGNPNSEGDRISGESSPEPEVIPPAKKAGRRSKAALAKQNVNNGVALRRDSHQPSCSTRKPYYTNSSDIDDGATYGRIPRRHQGGVRIHRDNTGPAITFNALPIHVPGQMPPMSVLTSGLTQLAPHGSYQQQSFLYDDSTMRPSNMHIPRTSNSGNAFAAMSYQSNNFGSFGQLNNISMTGAFGGSSNPLYGRSADSVAPGVVQQQPQYGNSGASHFQSPTVPNITGIDPFTFPSLTLSPHGGRFDGTNTATTDSGFFFEDNLPPAEDDGATISLANSEA